MRHLLLILASLLTLAAVPAYPESDNPAVITFNFHAPDARSVEVIGDFNSWLPGSNFLPGPDKQGMWQALIAMPSGTRYVEYIYLVNGQRRFLDPVQPVVSDDFGGKNNVWLAP